MTTTKVSSRSTTASTAFTASSMARVSLRALAAWLSWFAWREANRDTRRSSYYVNTATLHHQEEALVSCLGIQQLDSSLRHLLEAVEGGAAVQ